MPKRGEFIEYNLIKIKGGSAMNGKRIEECFEKGKGVFHLMPTWVPRTFGEAGYRLHLHPDDYWAFGLNRGPISERWFGSVNHALNGPLTGENEGMSYVLADAEKNKTFLFKDAMDDLGERLIGRELVERYGTWPVFAKFYDYSTPLFHHLHMEESKAQLIGMHGKPEAYYFPAQLNNTLGRCPVTYFGFDPDTDPEDVKQCIRDYDKRDNRITQLSRAYRIKLGTGWYTPAGVIHAPASVLTYEPQWNSDVNTIMENVTMERVNPHNMLTDCCPEDKKDDVDFIFSLIDWEKSTDAHYKEKYYREPKPVPQSQEGLTEKWVAYANEFIAAKEVTVAPGAKVTLKDRTAYGVILTQGYGRFGEFDCEAAQMLRFGQQSGDEFFVSEQAAQGGIVLENHSRYENLVFLQNFANNNPGVPKQK